MDTFRRRALACTLVAALGAPAGAQEILLHVTEIGETVSASALGDVDGDGFDDFLIGDHRFDAACCGPTDGKVRIISGADGSVLHEHVGDENRIGSEVADVGDLNSDGVTDYAVGVFLSNNEDEVFVYSGLDGSLLLHLEDFSTRTTASASRSTPPAT